MFYQLKQNVDFNKMQCSFKNYIMLNTILLLIIFNVNQDYQKI